MTSTLPRAFQDPVIGGTDMHSDAAARPSGSRSDERGRSSDVPRNSEVRATSDAQPGRRLIKRYSNRKLYDTHASRYVTLTQIAEMVGDGEIVKVVDNKTREDKTEFTFAQVILEQLKSSTPGVARVKLAEIIRECQRSRPGAKPILDIAGASPADQAADAFPSWQTHMEGQLEQLPAAEAAAWRARLRDLNARLGELQQRALQAGVATQIRGSTLE